MSTLADKINRYNIKRSTAYNRLQETHALGAQIAQNPSGKGAFMARAENLSDVYSEFQSAHNSLIGLIEEGDFKKYDALRIQADESFYGAKAIYHDNLISDSSNTSLNISSTPGGTQQMSARLPKINTPVFSGDFKDWPSFYDLFNSLVHDNTLLSPVEKFKYLLTSLEGEPLSLIKGIPLTHNNYKVAYEKLQQRYQNKRFLATFYFNQIYSATPIQKASAMVLRCLLNTFSENVSALRALQLPVDHWDFLLFNILLMKLDSKTKTDYEVQAKHNHTDLPTYRELIAFLENQCQALESVQFTTSTPSNFIQPKSKPYPNNSNNYKQQSTSSFATNLAQSDGERNSNPSRCLLCKQASHTLNKCTIFLSKTPHERYSVLKQHNRCINCLRGPHTVQNCGSSGRCRICSAPHHTLIHFTPNRNTGVAQSRTGAKQASISDDSNSNNHTQPSCPASPVSFVGCTLSKNQSTVMLSTAEVDLQDASGNFQKVRVLLDTASMANFISEACVQRLGLQREHCSVPIEGLSGMSTSSTRGVTHCTLKPHNKSDPTFNFEAVILSEVCTNQPKLQLNPSEWVHIRNLPLADSKPYTPGKIDALIGAELFPFFLGSRKIFGEPDQPVAMETIFGYILQGKAACRSSLQTSTALLNCHISLDDTNLEIQLEKFWQIEQIPKAPLQSPDDLKCEEIYKSLTYREPSGRFAVPLPFKHPNPNLGDSYTAAYRRFRMLEVKLSKNPEIQQKYSDFMREYLASGHMTSVPKEDYKSSVAYYVPHFCVWKTDLTGPKIRVVFDSSQRSSSGTSLNEALLTGPKLQRDISSVLLSFRLHAYCFVADCVKMYRQILIQPQFYNFQRILWRFSPSDPLEEYFLVTVFYGSRSSPYLALRTLQELANQEEASFPEAAKVLKRDNYIDDYLTGSDSLESTLSLQTELIQILQKGGFQLSKWASNHPALLADLPPNQVQTSCSFDKEEPSFIKILGLKWDPNSDVFSYSCVPLDQPCTKRNILSQVSRIFDPLGFISPVTLLAKYLLQRLWASNIPWDGTPTSEVLETWNTFKSQLHQLEQTKIPRRVVADSISRIELHGFCDASQVGYSSVIYFRILQTSGFIKTSLVCAKCKVSPLKVQSIPKLELMAAVLLSNLVEFVQCEYADKIIFDDVITWSDSQVALTWLCSSPHRWKTFIANRVSHVQEIIPISSWRYVPSADNPADCASRGLFPAQLLDQGLWWSGPSFLLESPDLWPPQPTLDDRNLSEASKEDKRTVLVLTTLEENRLSFLLNQFSSLSKIERILAYVLRFISNVRAKSKSDRLTGHLTPSEVSTSLLTLVKHAQSTSFSDILLLIENNHLLPKPFRKLALFVDSGLLRVGGRIRHSRDLGYDVKHPLLMPKSHRLTELIIERTHRENLHPGLKSLHYLLLQQFWVLSPRSAIHKCLSKCIRCFRCKPKSYNPYMADLPYFRVSQLKPFSHVCIDFAGPFSLLMSKHRGAKTYKGYVCVFVCTATKSLHFELTSDMTAEAFLAAFRRFVARRGSVTRIFTDQGTNFKGAARLLNDLARQAAENLSITWSFNPPGGPHFNGLVEAGVKSCKTHLYRVIGSQTLTFEEFYTFLTQVESLLNSRPLCAISADPNDLQPLSPSHFLTLEPTSTVIPDPDLSHININRLNRWQLIQKLQSDYWKRWSQEYLHSLQERHKWSTSTSNLKENALCLIKNEQSPPLHWVLGRIVKLYPGKDGVVRVADLKTSTGLLQRPIVKLCPLPQT